MEKHSYVIGLESLHDWEQRNNHPTDIVLTGNVPAKVFTECAYEFDYTKYRHISFEDLTVQDVVYDNGLTCSYTDYLSQLVCGDAIRLFVLTKLYLNLDSTDTFVVNDNCVLSADNKTLVHIQEVRDLIIPRHIEHIGHGVCCGYNETTKVTLNNGLKSIGRWAFVGVGITRLDMPDTLLSLGEDAFLMSDLETVKLSNSLDGIPEGCFDLCSLENINIPHSVRYIGDRGLRGLIWADEIKIPEGVERIGYDVFEAVCHVTLPSTLTEIAPDFYYEEWIDDPDYPPYIEVHQDNKVFFSAEGSLYFRDTGKIAIDSKYNGPNKRCRR